MKSNDFSSAAPNGGNAFTTRGFKVHDILELDCPDGISVIKPTVYLENLDLQSAIIKDSWE